jgi:hypothetical protein
MKILPKLSSYYLVGLFLERRPLLKRSGNGVVSKATRLRDVQLRNRPSVGDFSPLSRRVFFVVGTGGAFPGSEAAGA